MPEIITTQPQSFYSLTEVCDLLKITRANLNLWRKKGKFPATSTVKVGHRVLFKKPLVDAWIESFTRTEGAQ